MDRWYFVLCIRRGTRVCGYERAIPLESIAVRTYRKVLRRHLALLKMAKDARNNAHTRCGENLPTTATSSPQTIRKSLSLTIVAIGVIITSAGAVDAHAKGENRRTWILSGASLAMIGAIVYRSRLGEEKNLREHSQL
jgi:hypothetical protein